MGSASAAMTMNSDCPLFKVLVAVPEEKVVKKNTQNKLKKLESAKLKQKYTSYMLLTLVGTLLELLVVVGLLHNFQDLDCQLLISKRVCFGVYLTLHLRRRMLSHARTHYQVN
jgi:hypothetical protein